MPISFMIASKWKDADVTFNEGIRLEDALLVLEWRDGYPFSSDIPELTRRFFCQKK